MACAAADAVEFIGMPEGRIPLAEATIFLALSPKSNAAYSAINAAISDVREGKAGSVPVHLRDGSYPGAKALGHGRGYVYAHDAPHAIATQAYLPDSLKGTTYYAPTDRGAEANLGERWERIQRILRGE
jgi:putative ATPase